VHSEPLSGPRTAELEGVNHVSFLTFYLREEIFGLDIKQIREILPNTVITQMPRVSDTVRGVINLRGAVIPVIDLNRLIGRQPSMVDSKTCIVILDTSTGDAISPVGLMVDSVCEVVDLAQNCIDPAPHFGVPVERELILGISKFNERFVVLLDVKRCFELENLQARIQCH
jgi:purine-binding chemotaxis protein CheW